VHVLIRSERPDDIEGIREVNREAFRGDEEADLVDRLRDNGDVVLSLVAIEGDRVIGHILFSRLRIGETNALALAPMAVKPAHQRRGVGSTLVRRGLASCRTEGETIVVVVGHPEYYPRFGFSADLAKPLDAPFSGLAFMALELQPGALMNARGRVTYARAFRLTK
jgi:putative acetyltransferase